jgi:large subunit ribosomal protein L24
LKNINPTFLHVAKHVLDSMVASTLNDSLRQRYKTRNTRVIKGDSVRVMRGEYSGIEGKVEKVNTARATLSIEGIQREKIRGGNVKVQIHASNVMITTLNLDDKYRQTKLERLAEVGNKAVKRESAKRKERVTTKKEPVKEGED